MPAGKYDILIIGAGSAGLSVGLTMQTFGFKVLLISKTDHAIGGDCLNDGCVPSKSFIHIANLAAAAKEATKYGLEVKAPVQLSKALNYVKERQEIIRAHENADWLKKKGIDIILGEAQFVNKYEVEVNGKNYTAKKIVIATGSRPKKLDLPGVEMVKYFDNENIFEAAELPKRLVVIGAGPIGLELAEAMLHLGSEVTVIDMGKNILSHDDEWLTKTLQEKLEEKGIQFIFEAELKKFISANELMYEDKEKKLKSVQLDVVLVGIGRDLNIEKLNLEKAEIKTEKGEIVIDEYLRTSNKKVFVCGDVAGDLQFSHAAEFHARILLNNFFSPLKKKLDNKYMSWVTFTQPQLASFGLNEMQLKKAHKNYIKLAHNFDEDDRAVTDNYQYGKMIIYLEKSSLFGKQKILGGSMLAPNAGEIIQELILAMKAGVSINQIFNKIYPYPVAARVNQQIISSYKQRSLNPLVKKGLHILYKIFN